MKRMLLDGTEVIELDKSIHLNIKTKCPEKWLLIDRETGDHYVGYETEGKNSWRKLDDNERKTTTSHFAS